jgi:hypothetical protein
MSVMVMMQSILLFDNMKKNQRVVLHLLNQKIIFECQWRCLTKKLVSDMKLD